jgi:DNA-binding MarR family transcriptional regulator
MKRQSPAQQSTLCAVPSSTSETIQNLAWFRYNLRKFLRFSEKAARECGVTPQQHQLMLGIAGYTGRDWATISELAEFLQERHNSVVGLVERAARCGLVRKEQDANDRRFVFVSLTPRGASILTKLTEMHQKEVRLAQENLLKGPQRPSQMFGRKKDVT